MLCMAHLQFQGEFLAFLLLNSLDLMVETDCRADFDVLVGLNEEESVG